MSLFESFLFKMIPLFYFDALVCPLLFIPEQSNISIFRLFYKLYKYDHDIMFAPAPLSFSHDGKIVHSNH